MGAKVIMFGKILNSKFLKGLVHSALHCVCKVFIQRSVSQNIGKRQLLWGPQLTLKCKDSPVKACVWHFVETQEGRFPLTVGLGQVFHNWHFYHQDPRKRWCQVGRGKVEEGEGVKIGRSVGWKNAVSETDVAPWCYKWDGWVGMSKVGNLHGGGGLY